MRIGRRFVTRNRDGSYRFQFPANIRMLVVQLGAQLNNELDEDSPDLVRLFPTAYPNDPELDAGYQALARDELADHRRTSFDIVRATLEHEELDDDQLSAWMTVTNDLRLVLGTRLDVSEDTVELDDDDPLAPAFEVYSVLGFVVGEIVDALSSALPDEGTGDRQPPEIDLN